ncbi:outer membrane protein assembly factor BamB family protein [Aureliella helgolandensis]|uniref:PQQ enzyme repeat protein n=1 Tax=Aureliella helgolandensis TaxID=2527968 RepID=A0A518G2Z1_9BACT|nr:PQQ-binding-like beta-propeller repeat protein [Aureliella helgolandensis]QDV22971.1 PQQ enzyme repeat protein [Aureliella helgolandensis]
MMLSTSPCEQIRDIAGDPAANQTEVAHKGRGTRQSGRALRKSLRLGLSRWQIGLALFTLSATLSLTACAQDAPSSTPAADSPPAAALDAPQGAEQEIQFTRTAGSDWTAFLGPNGDGTSPETGVRPDLWSPHPAIRWSMPLGVSYGGPTICQGRLLQFDRFGNQERLTCFEAETARELWRFESSVEYDDMYGYNNGPRCSPIVDGDLIYTYGVTGRLSCVELKTGKRVWSKDMVLDYDVVQNFFGVASSPFVFQDLLLVMVGGSTKESLSLPPGRLDQVEPSGSAIVALDKRTGQEVYRLGDDLASYASLTVREIEGEPTGLAFLRNGLLAWEPQSGKQRFAYPWRAPMLESVNAALPVTSGDRILLSEAYEVGSVLLESVEGSPEVVWKDSGPRNKCSFRAHWSTPVLIDGYLYGCNGRNQPDSDLRCVRLADGEVQWMDRRHERSSVLAVDGYLIVLGEYGRLDLIRPNPEKLEVVRTVDLSEIVDPVDGLPLLDYPCWAAPVLSHGQLYLRGNRHLVSFDLIPGT